MAWPEGRDHAGFTGIRHAWLARITRHPQALAFQPLERWGCRCHSLHPPLKPQGRADLRPIGGYRHPTTSPSKKPRACFLRRRKPASSPGPAGLFSAEALFSYLSTRHGRVGVFILRLPEKTRLIFGKNPDIDLASIALGQFPDQCPHHYSLVAQKRDKASACHESQGEGIMSQGLMGWLRRTFGSAEHFYEAYPAPETGT